MPARRWSLEVFVTDDDVEPYSGFTDGLDEFSWVALDAALTHVLAERGLELVRTEWLKPVGDGLHEFRIRHSAAEIIHMFGGGDPSDKGAGSPKAILLRVFVHFHGQRVILLISGYDKGDDPSERRQQREISAARRYLRAWRAQEVRRRPRRRAGRPEPGSPGSRGR